MKRYADCPFENSACRKCSLSSYERDCHSNPAGNLSYWMSIRGMTQSQLAKQAGTSQQAISRFVSGVCKFEDAQLRTVLKISNALGVTVEDLLDEP